MGCDLNKKHQYPDSPIFTDKLHFNIAHIHVSDGKNRIINTKKGKNKFKIKDRIFLHSPNVNVDWKHDRNGYYNNNRKHPYKRCD